MIWFLRNNMSTIFGKIIQGEASAEKVFENERILAIKDINPEAPVHLLIMPKEEFSSLQTMSKRDFSLISEIVEVAQNLAKEFGIEGDYRFLTNVGSKSGQTIHHLHFHLIGGKTLGPMA